MVPPFFMVDIGHIIEQELIRQERSVTWFAKKLFCDRTNIYKIFKKQSIDTNLLLRISIVLKYDFFQYYAEEFIHQQTVSNSATQL